MLYIKNLSVSYGKTKILNNINLQIEHGMSMALMGESGTGKTTLARSILGLCDGLVKGELIFEGHNLLEKTEQEIADIRWNEISMVFQNIEDALNPLHSVIDQVIEPIVENWTMDVVAANKRAVELLELAGIPNHLFKSYPHQLSGGQKQRVLIAMALANNPKLLILDEPTSALDPITKKDIIHLLQKIKGNCSLLVVTHDFSIASKLADKTAVLYGGWIVEEGRTENILSDPKHPYTRGLLRSYPNMTTTKDLQGIPGHLSRPERGCPFEPRCTQSKQQCKEQFPNHIENHNRIIACHFGGIIPSLEVKGITKAYGKVTVLSNIDLTLYEGETISLVGESGSGKTTLARAIMGILGNSAGSIFLHNKQVMERNKEFYQQVQMIYQNPAESISHRFNVLEAVMEPLELLSIGSYEERIDRVKKSLTDVELPSTNEFLSKYPHHLSGGEAQRVAIARALILEPRVLIADEPTSALDPSVQAKILKLLLNLQEKKGLSILFITHDIAVARKISDRIVVLKDGRVVEEGASALITTSPKHPYTESLLSASPSLFFEDEGLKLHSTIA